MEYIHPMYRAIFNILISKYISMDKNKKYRKTDEDGDEFEGTAITSKGRDRKNREGYDARDTDFDDELGTEYEDLEDQWYEIETDYRETYPDLTDEDVNVEPGRFDRTLHRIGQRTKRSPFQVRQDIENWG